MEDFDKVRNAILEILSDNPKGLTTSQICAKSGFSRVATAKYLEMLKLMGLVDYRKIGPSKLYTTSNTAGSTYSVRGRPDILEIFIRMTQKARKELVGFTTANGLTRLSRYMIEPIKQAKARGIFFRILGPVDKSNIEAVKLLKPFVEVRHSTDDFRSIYYYIRDREAALLVSAPSDDVSSDGADVGIMMKAEFAQFMHIGFEKTWKSSTPLEERIKQLEQGKG